VENIEKLVDAVIRAAFIPLEASGRHVHVTKEQALTLFGHDLTEKRPLSQPGQYLCNERVTVEGPKGKFQNVAVLGPARKEAQVEISLTDGRALGITPPVRLSGDVRNTPGVRLVGPNGQVELENGVIAAKRHIHMSPQDARNFGVTDGQDVSLKTYTGRQLIFENVPVRVRPDFATYAHLDYDEANACGMRDGDLGRILK
jgi:propanediol utilization protein